MTISTPNGATAGGFATRVAALVNNIGEVIKGKPEMIRLVVTCLLAEGHILIEDVPGVGKTSMARASGSVHRRQLGADPVHARISCPRT